jgi:hypothetical protein
MSLVRQAKRLLSIPGPLMTGYYGAFLAKFFPRRHEQFVRSRLRGPYRGPLVEELEAALAELDRSQDQGSVMETASTAIGRALVRGDFDRWIKEGPRAGRKATLIECADFLPGRSWKLQLFFIDEGHSHPPHSHTDVTSCLVVADGKIHAREYDRFHDKEDDGRFAMLTLASDRTLSRGDALRTTRTSNNVHWFGAVNGPAAAFNFQAVGYTRGRRPLEARRIYVDPTGIGRQGPHRAPLLDRKEAKRRFARHPVADFPLKP